MQLVILAAGMGSRFGGLKQMEPMDEAGNFLLDSVLIDSMLPILYQCALSTDVRNAIHSYCF